MSKSKRPPVATRHPHPLLPSGFRIVVGKKDLEIEADPDELKAYPQAWRQREQVPPCPSCDSTEVAVLYSGPQEVRDEQVLDRLLGLRIRNRSEHAIDWPLYECRDCCRKFYRADRLERKSDEMESKHRFLKPGDPGYERFQNIVQIGGSTRTGSIVDGRYRTLGDILAMIGRDVDGERQQPGATSVPAPDNDGTDGSSAGS